MVYKHNRTDFFETNLLPAMKTNHGDLIKTMEQYETKFNEQKERLSEVRVEKAKQREREESKLGLEIKNQ